jgi:FixJ family two-component response regulator
MMISVIDDDDAVREATANLLRSLGYEVCTFNSGCAFLDWSGVNDEVACVITDILMPGLDGFDLHRRLVDNGYCSPIIFLTALTDAVTTARMKECAVHGVLIKPCSEQSLIGAVRSALERGRRPSPAGPRASNSARRRSGGP